MSQQDYYAGWDYARIGSGTFTLTASTGAHGADTVTWNTGTYSHIDLSSVTGTSTYVSWATTLQTYLNSLGGGRPTYTVTFSTTTMRYSFSASSGTLALAFPATAAGTRAKHILGFSADVAATSSPIVSDLRPYYAIRAAVEGPSAYTFYKEDGSKIASDIADDGVSQYGITPRTLAKFIEWEQRMESQSAPASQLTSGVASSGAGVRTGDASSAVPWTWEHFFQHVRLWEPFAFHNTTGPAGIVCKMRKEASFFSPVMVTSDLSSLWNIPIKALYLGSY